VQGSNASWLKMWVRRLSLDVRVRQGAVQRPDGGVARSACESATRGTGLVSTCIAPTSSRHDAQTGGRRPTSACWYGSGRHGVARAGALERGSVVARHDVALKDELGD
jgi:hypothetical protein